MTRVCNKCLVDKPLDDFHTHRRLKLGKAYTCKLCVGVLVKAWSQTTIGKEKAREAKKRYQDTENGKAKAKAYSRTYQACEQRKTYLSRRKHTLEHKYSVFNKELLRNYGIGAIDWALMYNDQNGECAACCEGLKFDRTTHVDHNHLTGKVRGLLCNGCNTALGMMKENPVALRRLALYLEATC